MTTCPRRQYRSTLRAAQAEQTRQTIVAAASRLFATQGFNATTIDAVAEEAGVSRKTVFTAVGGKIELLKLALDWAIAGDEQLVAVADRPEVREVLHDDDPAAMLRGWAHVLAGIDQRVTALLRAVELAASVDDAARSLFENLQNQRREAARDVVHRLLELDALDDGLTPEKATDIAWLFSDPAMYDRLVRGRGWSMRKFGDWLGDAMCRELLLG
jgi:AcrR family transcriptional regulator